jgi:hypothetical protein
MLFKSSQEINNQDDKKYISNAISMNGLILFLSLMLGVSIISIWTDKETVQVTKAIYILLGSTITAISLLIIIWRKVKDNEMNYFLESFERIPIDKQKVKKYFILYVVLLIVLSLPFEVSRGMWLFWIECSILIFLMLISLWKFYKQIFTLDLTVVKPIHFKLPNFKSYKTLAIIIIGFVAIFFWLFIIKQLL